MISNRTCRIIAFFGIALILANIITYAYVAYAYVDCEEVLFQGESSSSEESMLCQVVLTTLLLNLALIVVGGLLSIVGIVGFLWIWTGKKDKDASERRNSR